MAHQVEETPATVGARDIGGDTGNRFRYQYAYGVILLAGALRKSKDNDYLAIYCEHHDDFICERRNGKFDAYQIKTAPPEQGGWRMTDPPLMESIRRCVALEARFPGQFENFYFASNLDPHWKGRRLPDGLWPRGFLDAMRDSQSSSDISDKYCGTFKLLLAALVCEPDNLLRVLRKIDLKEGPTLRDFREAVIAGHMPAIVRRRDGVSDGQLYEYLFAAVRDASTRAIRDPDRHLANFIGGALELLWIESKRIDCAQILDALQPVAGREATPALPLRLTGLVPAAPHGRPVNLLMPLGLSRYPGIALTVGFDAEELSRNLSAAEALTHDAPMPGIEPRAWTVRDGPHWPVSGTGAGLIWSVESGTPSAADLSLALAMAFQEPRPACGSVLVIALGAEREAFAMQLSATIHSLGDAAVGRASVRPIPVYIWSADHAGHLADEPLLPHVAAGALDELPADPNDIVESARRMRRHSGAAPSHLWGDAEALRLHDLSLLLTGNVDRPTLVDEHRAAVLIGEAEHVPHLLYALDFVPLGSATVRALAKAPAAVRAVAGFLSNREMRAAQPAFSVHTADGYRPARVATYQPIDWAGR